MTKSRLKWMTGAIDAKIRALIGRGASFKITAETLARECGERITSGMVQNYCRGIGLATRRPVVRVEKDALFMKDNIVEGHVRKVPTGICQWPLRCSETTAGILCDHHTKLTKQKRAA